MDNLEKPATFGHTRYTTKAIKTKNTTQHVLDTIMRKQTQIA